MKNLSREELKNVFGGLVAAPNCNVGAKCTLTTMYDDGTTTTEAHLCSMSTWGSTVTCYCGSANPVSSNGGMSRCWG